MIRRVFTSLLFSLILAVPALASADEPRHVRVIWEEHPSRQAYVSWSTDGPSSGGRVVWSTSSRATVSAYEHQKSPDLHGAFRGSRGLHYRHALLTDLEPSTRVYFRVIDGNDVSPEYWFVTAPADARPFVFLYGGDSRSDSRARRRMNERIRDLVEADPSIIALVHGGDYIMSGGSMRQWENWLDDWEHSITSENRVLPIIATRGNHETSQELFNRVFANPGDALDEGDWFTTQLGEDFLLVTLDSNVSQAGRQRAWLDQQLAMGQQYRWLAVSYHRPAYPAVKSPGGALYHWVPLFEQYNVDIALESDGHVLKRTLPIRDGQHDPTGVVYLGEGGLGVPQRTPEPHWYLEPPGMAMAANHVQAIRVTPQALYYAAILEDGELADTYTVEPKRVGKYVAPGVAAMRQVGPNQLEVVFTRPVRPTAAENVENYVLEPNVPIADIEYAPEQHVATIRTEEPVESLQRAAVRSVGDVTGQPIRPTTFAFPPEPVELPVEANLEQIGPGPEPVSALPVGPSPEPVPEQMRFRCGAVQCMQAPADSWSGVGFLILGIVVVVVVRRRRRPEEE